MENVVEFLLKLKDYASSPLEGLTRKAGGARRVLDEVTGAAAKTDNATQRTGKSIHQLENNLRRLRDLRSILPDTAEHQIGRINRLLRSTNAEIDRIKNVGVASAVPAGVGATTKPISRLSAVSRQFAGVQRLFPQLGGGLGLLGLLSNPAALLGGGLVAGGAYALNKGAHQEYSRIQFTNAYGGRGGRLLDSLTDQKASLGEAVTEHGRTLADTGMANWQIIDTLRRLGDVANGSESKLSGLVGVFAELQKDGVLSEDSLTNLRSNGFEPLIVINRKTGESFDSLFKRLDKGKITTNEVAEALRTATEKGGDFYENLKNLDDSTISKWTKLTSVVGDFAADVGEDFASLLFESYRQNKEAFGWLSGSQEEKGSANYWWNNIVDLFTTPVGYGAGTTDIMQGEDQKVIDPITAKRIKEEAAGERKQGVLDFINKTDAKRVDDHINKNTKDKLNTVTGGGMRQITINITKMVETINNTFQRGTPAEVENSFDRIVKEAMLRTLQSVAGR